METEERLKVYNRNNKLQSNQQVFTIRFKFVSWWTVGQIFFFKKLDLTYLFGDGRRRKCCVAYDSQQDARKLQIQNDVCDVTPI